jgi:hypothetical protein
VQQICRQYAAAQHALPYETKTSLPANLCSLSVSGAAIDTELSAGIVDLFSGEVVNAADLAAPLRLPRRLCPIYPSGR